MATKTWNQTSGNLASTDANWVGGVKPVAGDNLVFDATSTANCTQDLALAFGTITLAAGYGAGIVTQGAVDFSYTDFLIAGGVWTGLITQKQTCTGDWTKTGGTVTPNTVCITFTKAAAAIVAPLNFEDVTFNADCTITGTLLTVNRNFTIAVGKTATLNTTNGMTWRTYNGGAWANSGILAGSGKVDFLFYNTSLTFTPGVITAPMSISLDSSATGSYTATLSGDMTGLAAITVSSAHASNTMTLDLSATNYAVSKTLITLGTRAIINGRASVIRCTGFTQSGASSVFTQGGYLIVEGTANISNGAWAVNENATVDDLTQSGGAITVAAGKVLYYEKTLTQSGGTSSGTIAQFQGHKQPIASRPSDVTNL